MNEAAVFGHIYEKLSVVFNIEKVVLFGSRARGDAHDDSDWDVLVITSSDIPFNRRQSIALHCLGRRGFPLDLLVFTPQEAAEAVRLTGSALYWPEQEGRVLYAK